MAKRARLLLVLVVAMLIVAGVWVMRRYITRRPAEPDGKAMLAAAMAEVEAGRRTTPLIGAPTAGGDVTVTFLAKAAGGRTPRVVSDVTGWGEQPDDTFDLTAGTMTRVGRTDWYSLRTQVASGARIEYLIAYGPTDYRLDPHNPRQAAGPQLGGLQASEFVTPGYRPPREFTVPPVSPAGRLTEAAIESRALGGSLRAVVYTPAGYRGDGDYPLLVVLDLRSGQVSRALDWLIAHREIEPVVAVFVGLRSAGSQRAAGAPLREFLDDELPKWMVSRYGVSRSAGRHAIVGISFGAKDALDAALSSGAATNAFDLVGLLIPGRRISRADIDAIAERRGHSLRATIVAGRYDRANVATARELREALAGAGHCVEYTEVAEGHSAVTWTHHLHDVLVSLFGSSAGAPTNGG